MKKQTTLTLMVGLPGSNRSKLALELSQKTEAKVLSSEVIRTEIYGNKICSADENTNVFHDLVSTARKLLNEGTNVIIDASNTTRKGRARILTKLNDIKGIIINAVVDTTPITECNPTFNPDQKLSMNILIERLKTFQIPMRYEGFNNIFIENNNEDYSEIVDLLNLSKDGYYKKPEDNMSIGNHSVAVCKDLIGLEDGDLPEIEDLFDNTLAMAGLLHDIAKPLVFDHDSNRMENHEGYGAYLIMTSGLWNKVYDPHQLVWLINNHTIPQTWNNEKTLKKKKAQYGEELFNRLMLLHESNNKIKNMENDQNV